VTSTPSTPSTTVVQKYGGSSVADLGKIRQVAALVKKRRDEGHRVCVVVSAMGKTTDGLIAQAKEIAKEPARRELDMLLTVGERASAALLSMALIEMGCDAISFTGSQSGILTNTTHAGARILEVRPYRVQDELERGRVVVIAGFQGVSYAREITTLGRGGSDTTAVALAAALDASCEIYSDVDGIFTADPRVVPETRKIEALTHEEMQELAAAGAKVLNAQAVQFAKAKGIAIYALKTSDAGTGTVVRKDAPPPVGGVRGVAHRALLHSLVADDVTKAGALLAHLEQHHIPSGQLVGFARDGALGGVQCLVPPEDAHGFDRCCGSLPAGVRKGSDHGAVSLVGQGVLEDRRVVVEALALLDKNGVEVRGLSTSSFRVTALVDPARVEESARLLHAKFVVRDRDEAAGAFA
jgi:aspartate kinase